MKKSSHPITRLTRRRVKSFVATVKRAAPVITQATITISLCRSSARSTVSVAMLRERRTDASIAAEEQREHDIPRLGSFHARCSRVAGIRRAELGQVTTILHAETSEPSERIVLPGPYRPVMLVGGKCAAMQVCISGQSRSTTFDRTIVTPAMLPVLYFLDLAAQTCRVQTSSLLLDMD